MGESDEPRGQGQVAAREAAGNVEGVASDGSADLESIMLETTEAELDDWAERERKRRQEWLNGPTADERAEWARRERMRRLARLSEEDRDLVLAE